MVEGLVIFGGNAYFTTEDVEVLCAPLLPRTTGQSVHPCTTLTASSPRWPTAHRHESSLILTYGGCDGC